MDRIDGREGVGVSVQYSRVIMEERWKREKPVS